jgi:hypothetical protein
VAALDVALDEPDLARLGGLRPTHGDRYADMAFVPATPPAGLTRARFIGTGGRNPPVATTHTAVRCRR